jgi:hypothetical protein
MKTFIAKDVLRDHSTGMVVVCAESLEAAKLLIAEKFEPACEAGDVVRHLVELLPNSFESVHGGG